MPTLCCCCGEADDDPFAFSPYVDGGGGGGGAAAAAASIGVSPASHAASPTQLTDLELLRVIGRGTYGKVIQARNRRTGDLYALKSMRKAGLRNLNQSRHALTERSVLTRMNHPFVARLHSSFQTPSKLYLVLGLYSGGELFFHLRRERFFAEPRARLYAAEIMLALEALHAQDIAYRDLKPENVLLDRAGHVCLSDFGLSKENVSLLPGGARTCCGTPSYMAPEVLLGTGHGLPVDWWGFGTLLFEMLAGAPPFYSRNLHVMYRAILSAELRFPRGWKRSTRALFRDLLEREPTQRLGADGGGAAIRRRPFFRGLDFDRVLQRGYSPAFTPPLSSDVDTTNFDSEFTREVRAAHRAAAAPHTHTHPHRTRTRTAPHPHRTAPAAAPHHARAALRRRTPSVRRPRASTRTTGWTPSSRAGSTPRRPPPPPRR